MGRAGGWRVGARPLPLRPDGFGQVLATPAALRDRRLPTIDRLPPPPGGRFRSSVAPISPAVRARMGATWKPGCPVGLADLRYVTVSFRGFDGRAHTGELVLHRRAAADVVSVFARLYRARFPIEEMRLVSGADLTARPTGDGDNTAAFVCRAARKQTRWSAHAYGLAIDLDPFQNPYRRGDLVLPELASAYLDRGDRRPGMIHPGDVVTSAFAAIGWTWGGTWRSPKDLMHFSATGD
jgi:D-alanyl-D-alanine carboxypeptidase